MSEKTEIDADYFISRAGADAAMADIIAGIIRDAGKKPYYQDQDFGSASFMARMDQGFESNAQVIALLTPDYLSSKHCRKEANVILANDPGNLNERLIVLRIAECQPTGNLTDLAYTDLVPTLTDHDNLTRIVRVVLGIDRRETDLALWRTYYKAGRKIRHKEIRQAKDFFGRENMLAELAETLTGESSTVRIRNSGERTLALYGLGGVGKTVLARQYAWENQDRYHGIWWVRAESHDTIIEDLTALGRRIVPGIAGLEPEDIADKVLEEIAHMQTGQPWLLIYDNVDDQDHIRNLTPTGNAHVMVTTRLTDWYGDAEDFPVGVFKEATAVDFLLDRARNSNTAPEETRAAAGRLAKALQYLPLALSHARAYCWGRNESFDAYLSRLSEEIKRAPPSAVYKTPVYGTFSLAIERACEVCTQAEPLMALLSYLDADQIPLRFVTDEVMSEIERGDALAALASVSLVTLETLESGSPAVSVHRLVQEVMRARLVDQKHDKDTASLVTRLIKADYDYSGTYDGVLRNVEWLAHAITVLEHAPTIGPVAQDTIWIHFFIGDFRVSRGETTAPLESYRASMAIAQRLAEADPGNAGWQRDLSVAQEKIGDVLRHQGNLPEALESYRASMAIAQRLAEADPGNAGWQRDLSVAQEKIGDVLRHQGNLPEALESYRASMAIAQRLAEADPGNAGWQADLAASYGKLGQLHGGLGQKQEALRLLQAGKGIVEPLAVQTQHRLWLGYLESFNSLIANLDSADQAEGNNDTGASTKASKTGWLSRWFGRAKSSKVHPGGTDDPGPSDLDK